MEPTDEELAVTGGVRHPCLCNMCCRERRSVYDAGRAATQDIRGDRAAILNSNIEALIELLTYDGTRTRGEGSVLVGEKLDEYQERTQPTEPTVPRAEIEKVRDYVHSAVQGATARMAFDVLVNIRTRLNVVLGIEKAES